MTACCVPCLVLFNPFDKFFIEYSLLFKHWVMSAFFKYYIINLNTVCIFYLFRHFIVNVNIPGTGVNIFGINTLPEKDFY